MEEQTVLGETLHVQLRLKSQVQAREGCRNLIWGEAGRRMTPESRELLAPGTPCSLSFSAPSSRLSFLVAPSSLSRKSWPFTPVPLAVITLLWLSNGFLTNHLSEEQHSLRVSSSLDPLYDSVTYQLCGPEQSVKVLSSLLHPSIKWAHMLSRVIKRLQWDVYKQVPNVQHP